MWFRITHVIVGQGWKDTLRKWEKKLEKAVRMEKEVETPLKTFRPVNMNLKTPMMTQGMEYEELTKWGGQCHRELVCIHQ